MEYGLIKDTTMTAIADELRDKKFIPATEKGTIYLDTYDIYNTVTSKTDPTHKFADAGGINEPMYDNLNNAGWLEYNISIPGATKLRFDITIGKRFEQSANAGAPIGYMYVTEGTSTSATASLSILSSIDMPLIENHSMYINSYYGKLCIRHDPGMSKIYFGVIVKIYPLDADGNEIKGLVPKEVDVLHAVTPDEMIEALQSAPARIPDEAFDITGSGRYRFSFNTWNWFLDAYKSRFNVHDITEAAFMFNNSDQLESIPFDINVTNATTFSYAFQRASGLKTCPRIRGTFDTTRPSNIDLSSMLENCWMLQDLNDLFEPNMLDYYSTYKVTSSYTCPKMPTFQGCHSLRNIPDWWYKFRLNEESTTYPSASTGYIIYYYMFYSAYTLDEIVNMPVWRCQGALTSSSFSYCFNYTSRLKRFTFETDNGQPIVTKWKNQTIDLKENVGWTSSSSYIVGYNSGITKDKEVKDDTTYQALKNDPDWWTFDVAYSRYNHDSAVETINSLPDTSATGTNTIKFKGSAGSKTDGGAINTLTAEEIAVAAAKGWTVTLV